jgi:hypothetical protein
VARPDGVTTRLPGARTGVVSLTSTAAPAPITVPDYEPYQVRAGRPRSTVLRLLLCWGDPFPPLPHGWRRVHLSGEGGSSVAPPASRFRRYRMRFRPWATVDIRDHLMDFRFDCTTGDGRAGFTLDVTLNVRVTEPEQVVNRGVRRVRPYLVPDLSQRVHEALTDPLTSSDRPPYAQVATRADDPAATITAARREIEWLLRRTLAPGAWWTGSFYRAVVVGCRVVPDERTARRLEDGGDSGPADPRSARRAG